jgi:hypothetical protein
MARLPILREGRRSTHAIPGGKVPSLTTMKRTYLAAVLVFSFTVFPNSTRGQDLGKGALASFPPETIRLEGSTPAKLRGLPNYASLRQRYMGPKLQKLEDALSQLGFREDDIDEMVLGMRPGTAEMDLYGFASGRFDARTLADRAAAQGLSATAVAGQSAYCLGASVSSPCVAVLSGSQGAFGTLTLLTSMLEARAGQAPALAANERFARLVSDAPTGSMIWGVAVGPAVGDWFRGWMPGQGNVQMDWASVFQGVDSLIYSVDAADKVNLNLKLNCQTPEAAASLRQVLEGLKLAQELAWQSQNSGRPNPYQAMEVELNGPQLSLRLVTEYTSLEGVGGPGTAQK